jgi:hypothetical protein
MVLAHSLAFALSVMPGNRRRVRAGVRGFNEAAILRSVLMVEVGGRPPMQWPRRCFRWCICAGVCAQPSAVMFAHSCVCIACMFAGVSCITTLMVERSKSRPIRLSIGAARRAERDAARAAKAAEEAAAYPVPPVDPGPAMSKRVASGEGRKAVVGWLDPGAARRVKIAAATMDFSVPDIIEQAVLEWLQAHGGGT